MLYWYVIYNGGFESRLYLIYCIKTDLKHAGKFRGRISIKK